MKWLPFLFCGILVGCAATTDQAQVALQQRFVGTNVDDLVRKLGPPEKTFRMNDGSASYSWTLGSVANINAGRYGGTAESFACVVKVVAASDGKVTALNTTDASDSWGQSLCAERIGLAR